MTAIAQTPLIARLHRPIAVRTVDTGAAQHELRRASAELGETLAAHPPTGAFADRVATWLTAVASGVGMDLEGLPRSPVLLARAHAVVGRALHGPVEVRRAEALAAEARELAATLAA